MISQLLHPCAVGYLQFDVQLGDIENNLAKVKQGLKNLAPNKPGIIVLPELWATGFDYKHLTGLALKTPKLLETIQELAAKYGVYLAGSLPEVVLTEIGTSVFNTLYIIGHDGAMGSYRKQQLFAPMQEDKHFTSGDDPQPIVTPLGCLAALVCYDLRFPGLTQSQAAQGAGILLVSAQWPAVRTDHWRTLICARAIENQMFVVACNRCGVTDNITFAGHSMIVAPDGSVLAEAEESEEEVFKEIDPSLIDKARDRFNTVGANPYRFHDQNKIMELDELRTTVAQYKAAGRKVVFTNGCFDILHVGHATYLEAARKEGDCLLVGLNSDASIRSIKGPDRPVNNEQSRARVLAALGCVDHVVLFEEDTPQNLIETLMPDVLVKGGDWPVDKIVGAPEVMAAGGKVMSIPLVESFSTTSLLEKIKKQEDL